MEKKQESVVADTKNVVCVPRDTIEMSGYARGGPSVCSGVDLLACLLLQRHDIGMTF